MRTPTTTRMRQLLDERQIVLSAGVYDCLSALSAVAAGFDSLFLTGYGVAASFLGRPDAGLLNLSDFATICRNITQVVDVPLLVDVDTGFGNAVNVAHGVRVLEHAGAAGIHLEDQVSPKRCVKAVTHLDVIPVDEAVGKLRAAADARRDQDFLIEAASFDMDPESALDRCGAYAEAGADIIYARAFRTAEGAKRLQAVTGKPTYAVFTDPPGWVTVAELREAGVRAVALFAVDSLLTSYRTMGAALRYIHEHEAMDPSIPRASLNEFSKFIGFPAIAELEAKFLPEDSAHEFVGEVTTPIAEKG